MLSHALLPLPDAAARLLRGTRLARGNPVLRQQAEHAPGHNLVAFGRPVHALARARIEVGAVEADERDMASLKMLDQNYGNYGDSALNLPRAPN
jgi:hypothetical protein